jgi:hypothetical protein
MAKLIMLVVYGLVYQEWTFGKHMQFQEQL